ncbi:MAG: glyoxalase superfamily protein [Candidatus Methylomirabilales bacterium]
MTKEGAVLENAVPVLSVENVTEAVAYYRNVLGFAAGWTWGNPPTMANVCRDRVEINLATRGTAGPQGASCVYFHVKGIDDYFAECVRRGARILSEIADQEYGMRDFDVVDPDGNTLCFGESIFSDNG